MKSHPLSWLYNLYSEQNPLSLDPVIQDGKNLSERKKKKNYKKNPQKPFNRKKNRPIISKVS